MVQTLTQKKCFEIQTFISSQQFVFKVLLLLIFDICCVFSTELGRLNLSNSYAAMPHIVNYSSGSRFYHVSGGVALTQTAKGLDGWDLLSLTYSSQNPDGKRLFAQFRNSTVNTNVATPLYDWEIVPLVNFVASDTVNAGQSAVTLFGHLEDKAAEDSILKNGEMIINLHPAFINTLIGLRLLQADLMLIEPEAMDLFKGQGEYILGKGEPFPTEYFVTTNRKHLKVISEWLETENIEWQSYVIGDIDTPVTYRIIKNRIEFYSYPIWRIWNTSDSINQQVSEKKMQFLISCLSNKPFIEAKWLFLTSSIQNYNVLRDLYYELADNNRDLEEFKKEIVSDSSSVQQLDSLRKDILQFYSTNKNTKCLFNQNRNWYDGIAGFFKKVFVWLHILPKDNRTIVECDWLKSDHTSICIDSSITLLNFIISTSQQDSSQYSLRLDSIWREFDETVASHMPVDINSVGSIDLSNKIKEEDGINPVVYRELDRAIKYTALIRLFKKNNPAAFNSLVQQMQTVDISPMSPKKYQVETPTVYPRPNPFEQFLKELENYKYEEK
jgi:hypothetical protein